MTGAGPVDAELRRVLAAVEPLRGGEPAGYIPELARADPEGLAIAMATSDGAVYAIGHAERAFTIQSISKPFVYGLALEDNGRAAVLERVGVEPTGDAFNAIEVEVDTGRPYNPMVNAGAIVTAGLVRAPHGDDSFDRVLGLFGALAGHALAVDEEVYASERTTGHRNRAIAHLMREFGMLDEVDGVLDRYFRQCSVLVTCADLAVMAATLATGGRNPLTGSRTLAPEHVESVLSVMSSCGMYDFSGEWTYTVGLPAKSGVAGGVIAVLPGELGIAAFSPRLDARGNSVRGIAACQELSRRLGLHQFRPDTSHGSPVRRRVRGDLIRSARLRPAAEEAALARTGARIAVLELQGDLVFATAERALRAAGEERAGTGFVVLEGRRVDRLDPVAARLIAALGADLAGAGVELVVAGLPPVPRDVRAFPDLDAALEWCEDRLVAEAGAAVEGAVVPLAGQDLLAGLGAEVLAAVEAGAERRELVAGEVVFREGDPADGVGFLISGRLAAHVTTTSGTTRRVASFGPGVPFGEGALLDGVTRRALTLVAEAPSEVRLLPVARVREIGSRAPEARGTLAMNLSRLLAGRLARAGAELRALAG